MRQLVPALPISAGAKSELFHAYSIGFSTTLNHLMDIGAIIALVGALCGFVLVRSRDFVAAQHGGPPAGGAGAGAGAGAANGAGGPDGAPLEAIPAAHA
jgi:hypothetical protein